MSENEERGHTERLTQAKHRLCPFGTDLSAGDVDHAPTRRCKLAASNEITLPAILAPVPSVPHHFDDEAVLGESEVGNDPTSPEPDLVLKLGRRETSIHEEVEELTFELTVDLANTSAMVQAAT